MLLGPEQIASYACFTWACFILLSHSLELRRQQRAFHLDLLPTDEGVRILPEDARPLERRVTHLSERGGPYLLSNMIRLALGRFAVSHSPQDASETVRTQAEVDLGRMAASMATLHYLVWAIPALGFLGTVRGIGMALTVTPDISEEALKPFLDTTTRHLAVAFDTTLVALVLSLILMFLLHSVQRGEEALVLDNQQYCLEHLISRLYRVETPGGPIIEAHSLDNEFTTARPWPD
jgi:biopolymer transport protein ExbB/TolQ